MEFILLISVADSELKGPAEDALASLSKLILEFPSLIVQSTQGMSEYKNTIRIEQVFPVINHTVVWEFSLISIQFYGPQISSKINAHCWNPVVFFFADCRFYLLSVSDCVIPYYYSIFRFEFLSQ